MPTSRTQKTVQFEAVIADTTLKSASEEELPEIAASHAGELARAYEDGKVADLYVHVAESGAEPYWPPGRPGPQLGYTRVFVTATSRKAQPTDGDFARLAADRLLDAWVGRENRGAVLYLVLTEVEGGDVPDTRGPEPAAAVSA